MPVTTLKVPSGRRRQVKIDPDPRDHIGAHHYRRAWYEPALLADLTWRARRGRMLDIGAHVGNHTLWAAAHGLRVDAFEPNPRNHARLARNVALNGFTGRVTTHRAAVGAAAGTATLVAPPAGNTGMARVEPSSNGDGNVQVRSVDSYEFADVAVMKIDVEGDGAGVLAGATDTIRRCRPVVYVEAATVPEQVDVEAILRPLGYVQVGEFNRTPTFCWIPTPVLSVAVMAHPARRPLVEELVDALDCDPEVVWDRKSCRWDTGRRSLLAGLNVQRGTHHLVIQDDALPAPNLTGTVARILQDVPHILPVSLFMGRARTHPARWTMHRWVSTARRRKASFAEFAGPWWGQAVVVPTSDIEHIVGYGDAHPEIVQYDHRIAWAYQTRKLDCLYTVPSVVEHRRVESLLDHGSGPGRKAALFQPHPTKLEWAGRSVTTRDLPTQWARTFPGTPNPPTP